MKSLKTMLSYNYFILRPLPGYSETPTWLFRERVTQENDYRSFVMAPQCRCGSPWHVACEREGI